MKPKHMMLSVLLLIVGCSQDPRTPSASASQSATTATPAQVSQPSPDAAHSTNDQSAHSKDTNPPPHANRIVNNILIEQAIYGSGTQLADVTDRVVELLRSEPQGFTAQSDWMHIDPAPRKNKSLLIKYRYRDADRLFMVTGGNRASYSALIAIQE